MSSTINITGNTILDSPYEAFQFENSAKGTGSAALDQPDTGNTVTGVSITNNTVTNVGTFVFQDQAPGSATVSGTTATGVGDAGDPHLRFGLHPDPGQRQLRLQHAPPARCRPPSRCGSTPA